jgi:excisionase family DNA binding protein
MSLDNPLDPLVDAIANAVVERLQRAQQPTLLTIRQVAAELSRSERWVRGEIAAGRLECVREGKGQPRVAREAVDRYVTERSVRA